MSFNVTMAEEGKEFVRVPTNAFVGYIVPEELLPKAGGVFWTPSDDQVVAISAKLKKYLSEITGGNATAFDGRDLKPVKGQDAYIRYCLEQLPLLRKNYDQSIRQFLGTFVSGRKQVFCAFLPPSRAIYAKTHFLATDVGGPDCWSIQYDVQSKKFIMLDIHDDDSLQLTP